MKKQLLAFLISSLHVFYLFGASEDLLFQKVKLIHGNQLIVDVLQSIENQSTLHFAYSSDLAVLQSNIHVNKTEWQVKELLDYTFKNTSIAYITKGSHIVLIEKPKEVNEVTSTTNVAKVYQISGKIIDASTEEFLFGASVKVIGKSKGATTDFEGNFKFSLKEGNYELEIKSFGYTSQKKTISLKANMVLNVQLSPEVNQLGEVVIVSESPEKNVESTEMGTVKMDIEEIKKMPAFMGEVDIIKSIQTLPGVTTVGEGATGFNVRGGAIDQNLILLDNSPLYSSSHLFGFFSVFNADAISDVELYKGSIPSMYGGRASSVLDIHQKEADYNKIKGEGGIGVVSSRLTLQAPIKKDKASILVSGRRSYADIFLKLNPDLRDQQAYFYDLNTQISYKVNPKNKLLLSGYYGRDVFNFGELFGFDWGNTALSLRWKHTFNDRLFLTTSLIYTNYDYSLGGDNFFIWTAKIRNYNGKTDFTYYFGKKDENEKYNHKLTFGVSSLLYHFFPGDVDFKGENENLFTDIKIPREEAWENGFYIADDWKVNKKISISYGLRYSSFIVFGGKQLSIYEDNVPKSKETIIGTKQYESNEIAQHYGGFEPRLGVKYSLSEESSVKAGYNRMRQYVQLVSNSTNGLPTDIWKPSDYYTKPLISDQVAVGYFRNFKKNMYEASSEIYYKWQQNVIDYKNGAELFFNPELEQELLEGEARSYGLELMIKKNKGKLTGRVSYTLSQSERKVDSEYAEERINNGEYYAANQNKLHDLTIITSYEFTPRFSLSGNFSYSSGRPYTPASSKYVYQGITLSHYELRNNDQIPAYHRLDLSATLKNKKKKEGQKWESSWNFSIYNLYARKNVFSYNFGAESVTRLSILGTIIPAVAYNFKF